MIDKLPEEEKRGTGRWDIWNYNDDTSAQTGDDDTTYAASFAEENVTRTHNGKKSVQSVDTEVFTATSFVAEDDTRTEITCETQDNPRSSESMPREGPTPINKNGVSDVRQIQLKGTPSFKQSVVGASSTSFEVSDLKNGATSYNTTRNTNETAMHQPIQGTMPRGTANHYTTQQGYTRSIGNGSISPVTTIHNHGKYTPPMVQPNEMQYPVAQAVPVATSYALQQHQLHLNIQRNKEWQLQTRHEENTECKPLLSFRVLSFLGGFSLIISAILTDIFERQAGNLRGIMEILVSIYLVIFGMLTCLLESGYSSSSSSSAFSNYCCSCKCLTHLRMAVLDNATFLRKPIGRALFYIFSGTLAIAQMNIPSWIAGGYVSLIGITWSIIGCKFERKLENVLSTINDEEMVIQLYRTHENPQGMLDEKGFTRIMQLVDPTIGKMDAYAAFLGVKTNRDGHMAFENWREWWLMGRKRNGLVENSLGGKAVGLVCYEI